METTTSVIRGYHKRDVYKVWNQQIFSVRFNLSLHLSLHCYAVINCWPLAVQHCAVKLQEVEEILVTLMRACKNYQ